MGPTKLLHLIQFWQYNQLPIFFQRYFRTLNKGAHVVQHYADGARLIGLTDAQLFKQLKLLKTHVNKEMLDTKELESPYAKSFHVGLLRSLMQQRKQRKNPVKPFALGGPRSKLRKQLKSLKHYTKISTVDNKTLKSMSKIKIRVVGLWSIASKATIPRTNVFPLSVKRNMDRRRKSIHATVHQQEADRPIQHLPGNFNAVLNAFHKNF